MLGFNYEALKRLEPYDAKVSRTVLRGRRGWKRPLCYPTLNLLKPKEGCSCLKRVRFSMLAGVLVMAILSQSPASRGEDGIDFTIRQAGGEVQKGTVAKDTRAKGTRTKADDQPAETLLVLDKEMIEQLNAIKTRSYQLIRDGNLIESVHLKGGCPSRLFGKPGDKGDKLPHCPSKADPSSSSSQSPGSQEPQVAPPEAKDPILDTRVLVFVSFSMPEASLKNLAHHAHKHNAVLVMRGLYQDSFVKTAQKLKELEIGVDINPELFETHHITSVPTFIEIKDEQTVCSLKGNVTLDFAVKKFEATS